MPRSARVATSDEIEIPCVLGFVRPLVVLPADMLGEVSPADLRRVVGHEAAHLERYDDWTNLIEQLVLAAFFYNPAMHFAVRQIATEREIACDDRVVMREGDTVTYAECLATLVHRAGSSRRLPVPGFHAGPRQIVVRIERLLDRAYSRSRRFGAGIAITASAVLLLAVTGVGNTVPVISDAIAPVRCRRSRRSPPLPRIVVPKLAAPAAKRGRAGTERRRADGETRPAGCQARLRRRPNSRRFPHIAPAPKPARPVTTVVHLSTNAVEAVRVELHA